jgi:hypothetical protein
MSVASRRSSCGLTDSGGGTGRLQRRVIGPTGWALRHPTSARRRSATGDVRGAQRMPHRQASARAGRLPATSAHLLVAHGLKPCHLLLTAPLRSRCFLSPATLGEVLSILGPVLGHPARRGDVTKSPKFFKVRRFGIESSPFAPVAEKSEFAKAATDKDGPNLASNR